MGPASLNLVSITLTEALNISSSSAGTTLSEEQIRSLATTIEEIRRVFATEQNQFIAPNNVLGELQSASEHVRTALIIAREGRGFEDDAKLRVGWAAARLRRARDQMRLISGMIRNPPPANPIQVVLLRDATNQLQATTIITNPLADPVPGVQMTLVRASTLDGSQFVDGVPVPQSFGTINPGQSVTTTVTFPGTAGVPSGFSGLVRVDLSYTGGTYTDTKQVITP